MPVEHYKNDPIFQDIIKDIINHQEFLKLKLEKHHDRTKFDHSYRVALAAYKYTKDTKMDTIAAVRGAMLHDFFFKHQTKNRIEAYFKHPKYSLKTAEQHFYLNKKEKNIISSHMFPVPIKFPRYKESLLITILDKTYSFGEMFRGFKTELIETIQKV